MRNIPVSKLIFFLMIWDQFGFSWPAKIWVRVFFLTKVVICPPDLFRIHLAVCFASVPRRVCRTKRWKQISVFSCSPLVHQRQPWIHCSDIVCFNARNCAHIGFATTLKSLSLLSNHVALRTRLWWSVMISARPPVFWIVHLCGAGDSTILQAKVTRANWSLTVHDESWFIRALYFFGMFVHVPQSIGKKWCASTTTILAKHLGCSNCTICTRKNALFSKHLAAYFIWWAIWGMMLLFFVKFCWHNGCAIIPPKFQWFLSQLCGTKLWSADATTRRCKIPNHEMMHEQDICPF